MKAVRKVLIGAAIGAGVLAVSAVSASASVVCSGNVCWHTKDRYHYPREVARRRPRRYMAAWSLDQLPRARGPRLLARR